MMEKDTQVNKPIPANGRLLGLDVGEKRIGIAISDELRFTAQPYDTLERRKLSQDLDFLNILIEEHHIVAVIVGLPKNMNGTLGPQAELVMEFAERLEERVSIPLTYWDERLSSVAADRVLLEADLSREKRKKHVDKLAATLILQGYLDLKTK